MSSCLTMLLQGNHLKAWLASGKWLWPSCTTSIPCCQTPLPTGKCVTASPSVSALPSMLGFAAVFHPVQVHANAETSHLGIRRACLIKQITVIALARDHQQILFFTVNVRALMISLPSVLAFGLASKRQMPLSSSPINSACCASSTTQPSTWLGVWISRTSLILGPFCCQSTRYWAMRPDVSLHFDH